MYVLLPSAPLCVHASLCGINRLTPFAVDACTDNGFAERVGARVSEAQKMATAAALEALQELSCEDEENDQENADGDI